MTSDHVPRATKIENSVKENKLAERMTADEYLSSDFKAKDEVRKAAQSTYQKSMQEEQIMPARTVHPTSANDNERSPLSRSIATNKMHPMVVTEYHNARSL
mmetsp:Transcript_35509/g.57904  ORF Transcript_35509/g.57904 Transcript_35509/m.57904 type:complete len:101 (+) Transcript_35509:132-434(+)